MHSTIDDERHQGTRGRNVFYWIVTGLLAAELLTGGIWDVMRTRHVVTVVTQLGYPVYLLTIVGVWKLLATPALLAPRLPLLKEWAYAGVFFEMTGAAASHAVRGEGMQAIMPLVIAGLAVLSWSLRPMSRWCGDRKTAGARAQEDR